LIAIIALIVILSPFIIEPILYSWSFTRNALLVSKSNPCKTFVSPDKRFKLEVYSKPSLMGLFEFVLEFVAPPIRASSSDHPVVVILRDSNGAIINSCDVPMMMLVDKVFWEGNSVRVPAVLDWDLPQETVTVVPPKNPEDKSAKH
jgi:hypothetical protein